ncbi:WASH complex subunit 2 isoform X2 [Chanos chanos]|uniref:WASH complex subunit 2 isoform X2 n=1 Tax=Chanos chanos TaxID=29144 RepID=A0A6J2V1T1_CHACN|nr:WASH complex subunit 2-like isoform X2 [Chanos chanos]
MENGPSNHNGETGHVWERPWTLEEMRKSRANWSLAADSGLFLFLQDFSQRMLSKTHEIEKQLDGLIRDTKATDSCLHTVFNDFLMLSNTQFIENRVYDEEVEEPVAKPEGQERQPEQEKTREQKEAELIPKVQEAVNSGLRVLESAFEQLDIKAGNSDSEDEEATDRVEPILEPKDLYVDRPLPYLIGSQAFMEQDDVGLGDLSSDDMSINSDRDSVIESEEDKDADQSDEDFEQDEDGHDRWKKKNSLGSYDEDEEEGDEDEDSDIFGESDKDEDEDKKDSAGPSSFADELAARIRGGPAPKSDPDQASLSSGPSVTKKKKKGKKEAKPAEEEDNDEMFKPPSMDDEEFSPFGGRGGLFSGGKGLFDDDDEGDLFSEAPKNEAERREQSVNEPTEPEKMKKIPSGAVSIFPEGGLFGNGSESRSPVKPKTQAAPKQPSAGGGLFDDDDDDDDDDFFSGKTVKKSSSAGQEKPQPKKTVDLFGGDEDDDGSDIFSGNSSAAPPPVQNKEVEKEVAPSPEKKMPTGAVSMFGPSTKNLLVEGLKKRQPSISEESEKSEESAPPPDVVKASPATKPAEKSVSKGLFSDDEDSQIFPKLTKSQAKPEPASQSKPSKPSKAALSLFDDDEEEDLFSSAPKSKSIQVKKPSPQAKKPVSSALFSDEEDQWMSSKPSPVKTEVKNSGMKASTSAPSSLPNVKAPPKDSLFNDGDEDDLFAATKESNQKKPQRVSLLFEDEDDDDDERGSLFSVKPPVNKTSPDIKVSAAASATPSAVDGDKTGSLKAASIEKIPEEPAVDAQPSPERDTGLKRKLPAGAVSLFGGINVVDTGAKIPTKSPLDDDGDEDFIKEAPPPMETKEPKAKKTTLSLFDDDDEEEEEEAAQTTPDTVSAKPAAQNTVKEQKSRSKMTDVFEDEELLFSQTQQKDNDPDVDLFSTTTKPAVPLPGSVKQAAPSLFSDDDEDDLFSSAKPKVAPKAPEKPTKPKVEAPKPAQSTTPANTAAPAGDEADLGINPSALLPGMAPRLPGAVSVMPGPVPPTLSSPSDQLPSPVSVPATQTTSEGGVSFDTPAQVTTLQSANKGRVKGSGQRRPQTRAARVLAAQMSEEQSGEAQGESSTNQAKAGPDTTSISNSATVRPSALTLPITTNPSTTTHREEPDGTAKAPPAAKADLFGSDDLFTPTTKHTPTVKHKTKPTQEDLNVASNKDKTASIFDDPGGDLFQTVKPKPVKKAKATAFLEDDDDDDIFGSGKSSNKSKTVGSSTKQNIFQGQTEGPPKAHKKTKEKAFDASLFDDNVDIFADLTVTAKPKEKKAKKKVETKSIFDDDMDDIFSSTPVKPVAKAPPKSKKASPAQEPNSTEDSNSNIFDDPLNVLGGN